MITNVSIMSQYEIQERLFSYKKYYSNLAIISINDYNEKLKYSSNEEFETSDGIRVLRCYFDDVGIFANRLYKDVGHKMEICDAFRIKRFIDSLNGDYNLWVHCGAGISRSGAVGCVIARYMNLNEWELFKTGKIGPNEWIYQMMCIAFNIPYSYEELRLKKEVGYQICSKRLEEQGLKVNRDKKTGKYSLSFN